VLALLEGSYRTLWGEPSSDMCSHCKDTTHTMTMYTLQSY